MDAVKKYKKEDLENLIIVQNLSYREIGRIYGVSDVYIKKVAKKLGIILSKRKIFKDDFVPHNKGKAEKINCQNCDIEITKMWKDQIYCTSSCSTIFRQKKQYDNYLSNQGDFCYVRSMRFIKPYILKEQNCKCLLCGIDDVWNGKKLTFVLDHIDGDASNNKKNNLRLICHNCDSQLDTYKSKNKNSARKERYFKNYKN